MKDFQKVLVAGAKHVGKTSLLSHIVNGEFGEVYNSTRDAQSFFDCFRGIEFIDAPGLSDVFGDEDVKTGSLTHERLQHLWDVFFEDQDVQTLLPPSSDSQIASLQHVLSQRALSASSSGNSRHSHQKKRIKRTTFDTHTISAYLIVFNDDASELIAKALWYALKVLKNKEKQVFVVRNVHMVSQPESFINQQTSTSTNNPKLYHGQAGFNGPKEQELKNIFDPKAHFPYFRRDEEGEEGVSGTDEGEEKDRDEKFNKELALRRKGERGVYLGEICVKTGEGIAEMLDTLSLHLRASQGVNEQNTPKVSRQCGFGDCRIM